GSGRVAGGGGGAALASPPDPPLPSSPPLRPFQLSHPLSSPKKSAPALSLGAVAAGVRNGGQGGARPPPPSPTTAGALPCGSRLGHHKPPPPRENAMFSIRNSRRPARSTSRRAGPRLESRKDRTGPAHRFVNTASRAIDHTDNLLSRGEAPALTAEAIFHQHAPRIYNLARRMLSNDADVEDVTQN